MPRGKNLPAQRQAERLELKQKKLDAGVISERFPQISKMVIQMRYFQSPSHRVLMLRTLNVFPTSSAYFHMKCVKKDCTDGGFDLTPVIKALVKHRKRTGKGKISCKGVGGTLPRGHASISYEINIDYHKHKRSQSHQGRTARR
jgi:hypothetical protein